MSTATWPSAARPSITAIRTSACAAAIAATSCSGSARTATSGTPSSRSGSPPPTTASAPKADAVALLRVALTGGIATGKSYVRSRLAAHGIATLDADVLARDAVAHGTSGLAAVAGRFGADVLLPDGSLDRRALGVVVFGDAQARADLEA